MQCLGVLYSQTVSWAPNEHTGAALKHEENDNKLVKLVLDGTSLTWRCLGIHHDLGFVTSEDHSTNNPLRVSQLATTKQHLHRRQRVHHIVLEGQISSKSVQEVVWRLTLKSGMHIVQTMWGGERHGVVKTLLNFEVGLAI